MLVMSCWSARLMVRRSSVGIQNCTRFLVFLGANHIAIGLNNDNGSRRLNPRAVAQRFLMYSGSSRFLRDIVSSDVIKVKKPVRTNPRTN